MTTIAVEKTTGDEADIRGQIAKLKGALDAESTDMTVDDLEKSIRDLSFEIRKRFDEKENIEWEALPTLKGKLKRLSAAERDILLQKKTVKKALLKGIDAALKRTIKDKQAVQYEIRRSYTKVGKILPNEIQELRAVKKIMERNLQSRRSIDEASIKPITLN